MSIIKEISEINFDALPLTEAVYQKLLRDILTGHIKKDSRLVEQKVCEMYSASRTPVREALGRLEKDGVIRLVPNKGAIVTGFSDREISDFFEMRTDYEILAVRWGIERITEEQMDELDEIYDFMKFYTAKDDIPKMISINTAFHRQIYKAAHNRLLEDTLIRYQTIINYCSSSNYFAPGYLQKVFKEHSRIYNAFKNENPDNGARAMKVHMKSSMKRRG